MKDAYDSPKITIQVHKNENTKLGITIGGGRPLSSTIYVVNVIDGGIIHSDGRISSGDELISINDIQFARMTRYDVATYIRTLSGTLTISYKQIMIPETIGLTYDIQYKKAKHWFVHNFGGNAADTFGLTRAVLNNDPLFGRITDLNAKKKFYKNLITKATNLLKAYTCLGVVQNDFGSYLNTFGNDNSPQVRQAIIQFSKTHEKIFEKTNVYISEAKAIIDNLRIFVDKVIPDVVTSIHSCLGAKFEYLAYSLKVKEIEDDLEYAAYVYNYSDTIFEGNMEYRVYLRSRYTSKRKFCDLREDVLTKLDMLDDRHGKNMNEQFRKFAQIFHRLYDELHLICESSSASDFQIPIELPKDCIYSD